MSQIAAIQMASGPHVTANLHEAARLIGEAVAQGAGLCVLPENFALMGMHPQDTLAIGEEPGNGPIQAFLAQQAARHHIWLIGGTLPLRATHPQRVRAACLVFDDQGKQVARYDKMHLFDVDLGEPHGSKVESYRESDLFEAGERPVVVHTPYGCVGLAVCYDLRFPELFRCLLDQGAELCVLPSAFTAVTGKAHWETLIRARAIENLCYLIAPNQGGYHVNGRETYGDSLIVDPWGVVLARLPRNAGIIHAELDIERLNSLRRSLPSIHHRRLHCGLP